MMDARVAAFSKKFADSTHLPQFPVAELRFELLDLHASIVDEASRIELVRLFNLLCDFVEQLLIDVGEDTGPFLIERQLQTWLLLGAECRIGETGVDVRRLRYVTTREIAAGRMEPTDPYHRWAHGEESAMDEFYARQREVEARQLADRRHQKTTIDPLDMAPNSVTYHMINARGDQKAPN